MAKKINIPKKYMKRIAAKGRYGDTELVHVNKDEKKILSNYRGGPLTTNPNTGLKEAFPWVAAGAIASGIGSLIGGSRAKKAARRARAAQLRANERAYAAAKKRTPEELQYVQRMEQRAQKGAMDVPQLESDLSRGAWSQARQASQEQEGAMAMRGMENTIVADELRRKTDTDTMRMVSDQARKIAMANEQTKMQAQGGLDKYQLDRANYLRQIGSQYEQAKGGIQANYQQAKGQAESQMWGALGNTISSAMGGIGQYRADNFGAFANISNPADFMGQFSNQGSMDQFVAGMSTSEAMQFYNWTNRYGNQ